MAGKDAARDSRQLLDEISRADLPENWQTIADIIGLAALLKLCKDFGGTSLYVPKLESIIAPAKRRLILKKFDGGNHKELAQRFHLSERNIYDIVAPAVWEKNQLSLF
ncbi:Mor transcription activator family protein [Pectinatus frisingensis]|uniref:Mor transcription activator family protein n=1 Tax=Pectinatus frisingensis TaxID=865 RepID=UPI003D80525C